MNGIDIIYHDQDCNMKFISKYQQLCTDCYNNSKKDPNYPYITLATDPSWIIMEYISYNNSEIYIKCSHDQKYEQEYEHSYKKIYNKEYDQEYTQEYDQEYTQEYDYEYDYKYEYEYNNIEDTHQKLETIV
jgi:hypothetical protein